MLKNNRFWTIALVLVSASSFAQLGTSSPYSFAGLGELKQGGFTQHNAIGGAAIATQSENSFTPTNPASLANLRFTVYDVGAYMSLGKLSTNTLSANTRSGNINHFGMAFPLETRKKMAVSFGLNKYSDIGYTIQERVNNDTPSYYNLFTGSGGISRLFIGYAIQPVKGLNIGVNGNYNFGNKSTTYFKVYPNTDSRFSLRDISTVNYTGFDLDLGVQYSVYDSIRFLGKKNSILKHTLASVVHTASDLQGNGSRIATTFFGSAFEDGSVEPIDTIFLDGNLIDKQQKPLSFSLGYSIGQGLNWLLSAEAEKSLWSTITDKSSGIQYVDNTRFSLGFSVVPLPKYEEKGHYLGKIRYSAGLRYETLYYNFKSTTLQEVGISFGLGLPIVKSIRIEEEKIAIVSTINITAEYVKRGSTENGLIQEDYLRIGLGLNLNDKWFTRRKYR